MRMDMAGTQSVTDKMKINFLEHKSKRRRNENEKNRIIVKDRYQRANPQIIRVPKTINKIFCRRSHR